MLRVYKLAFFPRMGGKLVLRVYKLASFLGGGGGEVGVEGL